MCVCVRKKTSPNDGTFEIHRHGAPDEEALSQEQKSQLLAISFGNTYFRDKKTHQEHYN